MFCGTATKPVARVEHRCTSCGEAIQAGQEYVRWASFDGTAFTNKMHPECHAAHEESARHYGDSQWEYTPYSYSRGTVE